MGTTGDARLSNCRSAGHSLELVHTDTQREGAYVALALKKAFLLCFGVCVSVPRFASGSFRNSCILYNQQRKRHCS